MSQEDRVRRGANGKPQSSFVARPKRPPQRGETQRGIKLAICDCFFNVWAAEKKELEVEAPKLLAAPVTSQLSSDEAEDVCFICAEKVEYSAVPECNHRTCHICALRLRALYQSNICAYCKTEQQNVIFTRDANRLYGDYRPEDLEVEDSKLGVRFETKQIMEDTIVLLRFNCSDKSCDFAANGWSDLRLHVRQVHHLQLCNLCIQHKKVFAHEHTLYTQKELNTHFKSGASKDPEAGFRGHPECLFCRRSFYGDDELFEHCRDRHERCHICDRLAASQGQTNARPQYFRDYNDMERHFRADHFLCTEKHCLDQKFVVFASDLDLKVHRMEVHYAQLSTKDLKDARRLFVPFNSTIGGYQSQRDHHANITDPEIEQQRQEAAYLRAQQQARERSVLYAPVINSDGGEAETSKSPSSPPSNRDRTVSAEFPALGSSRQSPSLPSSHLISRPENLTTPASASSQIQHQAVLDEVNTLLHGNTNNVSQFKQYISNFRMGKISAPTLIEQLWSLFNVKIDVLNRVINQVADLINDEKQKSYLLKAWNDFKIRDRQRSPFAAASSSRLLNQTASSHLPASRILRIKSSSSPGRWANPQQTWHSQDPSNASTSRVAPAVLMRPKTGVAWGGVPAVATPSTSSRSGSRSPGIPSRDAFPSLPSRTILKHDPVRPFDMNANNQWTSVNSSSANSNEYDNRAPDLSDHFSHLLLNGATKNKKGEIVFRLG